MLNNPLAASLCFQHRLLISTTFGDKGGSYACYTQRQL